MLPLYLSALTSVCPVPVCINITVCTVPVCIDISILTTVSTSAHFPPDYPSWHIETQFNQNSVASEISKKCRIMKLIFIPLGSSIWQNFRNSPMTLEWRWNCVSCNRRSVCFVKTRRTPATRGPMTADCPNIHHLPDPLTPTPIFQPLLQTPNFLALHPLFSQFDRSQYTKLTSVPLPLSYLSLIWIYRLAVNSTFHLNINGVQTWIYPWVLAREWL